MARRILASLRSARGWRGGGLVCVETARAYDQGGPIDLGLHLQQGPAVLAGRKRKGKGKDGEGGRLARAVPGTYEESKRAHDREYFEALWQATRGNRSAMSRRADLARETVRTYLEELGIRGREEEGE